MATIRDLGWWYWLSTIGLLASGLLLGRSEGIGMAITLCLVQVFHVSWLTRDLTAFPVQVRIVYLAMLVVGLWEPLHSVHWMQLIGTSARVLVGYCFLARTLSLAPWNRWQPMSLALIRRTFLSRQIAIPPCGEIFRRIALEQVRA